MKTIHAVTKAIKENKYDISVLWIIELSSIRILIGGLGSTFVASEIEESSEEEFISWLPTNTATKVEALTAGTYTFDAEHGEWRSTAAQTQSS
jgi:hypothetical protein